MRELSDLSHELLDTALSGGGVHELARTAHELLDSALLVCASNGTVLTTVGGTLDEAEVTLVAATMAAHTAGAPSPGGRPLGRAAARGPGQPRHPPAAPQPPLTEQDQRLLRLICQAMAVVLLQESSTRAVAEGQLRDELLEELLDDPTQSAQRFESRTRRLGIDLGSPHLVIIARPEGGGQGKAAVWASSYARRVNGLRCVHQGCVVLLVPGKDAGEAAAVVCDDLTPILGHPVTVAAAGPISGADDVWRGFLEAQRCLDAMTAFGATGRSASARQLGFLGLLLADDHDVEGFIDSVIGPVVDYDRQRFTDLIRTLETYFHAGSSPTKAAKVLHVHPNTVARRLERISELLGSGWQEPERLLEIQLALRLSRIRHGLHDEPPGPGSPWNASEKTAFSVLPPRTDQSTARGCSDLMECRTT
ncbi:helix-turn-helix domain-containing protein [Streptomyces sp. M19]